MSVCEKRGYAEKLTNFGVRADFIAVSARENKFHSFDANESRFNIKAADFAKLLRRQRLDRNGRRKFGTNELQGIFKFIKVVGVSADFLGHRVPRLLGPGKRVIGVAQELKGIGRFGEKVPLTSCGDWRPGNGFFFGELRL